MTETVCMCGTPDTPCPRCGEPICLACQDWERHHSLRGWLERTWARFLPKVRVTR